MPNFYKQALSEYRAINPLRQRSSDMTEADRRLILERAKVLEAHYWLRHNTFAGDK